MNTDESNIIITFCEDDDELNEQIGIWQDTEEEGRELIRLGLAMIKKSRDLVKKGQQEVERRRMVKDIDDMKTRLAIAEEQLQGLVPNVETAFENPLTEVEQEGRHRRPLDQPFPKVEGEQMGMRGNPAEGEPKVEEFWTIVGGEYTVRASKNEVYDKERNHVGKWDPESKMITIEKDEYSVTKSHCIFDVTKRFVGRWNFEEDKGEPEEKDEFLKLLIGDGEYGFGLNSIPSKPSRASTRYS